VKLQQRNRCARIRRVDLPGGTGFEENVTMRHVLAVGIVAGMCVTAIAAQSPGGSAAGRKLKNPIVADAKSVGAGKTAYQKNCRFCHGAEGLGDGPSAPKGTKPSDLTDKEWTRGSTDGEIYTVLRDGAGPKFDMKGFKNRMTDEDMWHVVNYIRSLAKK
jgi:mono/diheme cytochrome c family protein